jgi:hypothetical protein
MTIKHAAGVSLSAQKYAELVGRSPLRMPTALGKPAWRCSAEELRTLGAWHTEAAALFERLEDGTRAGVKYNSSYEPDHSTSGIVDAAASEIPMPAGAVHRRRTVHGQP